MTPSGNKNLFPSNFVNLKAVKERLFEYPLYFLILINLFNNSSKINTPRGLSMGPLPVSDAAGWFSCTKSLALFGALPVNDEEWCLRRPFFPSISSWIYRIFPHLELFLLAYELIFAAILIALVWQHYRLNPILIYFLTPFALLTWNRYGSGQTMSESLGLIFEVLFLVYFLKFWNSGKLEFLLGAFYLAVIGQMTRSGNLLVSLLPLTFLFWNRRLLTNRLMIQFGFMVGSLIATILIAQKFINSVFMTAGNTWGTIYSLQFGNRSWNSAYEKVPQGLTDSQTWSLVKKLTIEDIKLHPTNIIKSMIENSISFIRQTPNEILKFNVQNFYITFWILVAIYLIYTAFRAQRKSVFLTLSLFLLTDLLFYTASWKSDPYRAMSGSILISLMCLGLLSKQPKNTDKSIFSYYLKTGKFVTYILIIPILIFIPFMSKSVSNKLQPDFLRDIKLSQYQFTRNIENITGTWWKELVDQLPPGYLYESVYIQNGKPFRDNFYIKASEKKYLGKKDLLLCKVADSKYANILTGLGFYEATFKQRCDL